MNIQPAQPAPPAQAELVVAAASSLPQWEIEANTLNLQGEHRLSSVTRAITRLP